MDLEIQQKEAASRIGIGETALANWLAQRVEPALRHWPRVIAFLKRDPRPAPNSIGQALARFRQSTGQTQKQLARLLSVDPSTLAQWERGESRPSPRFFKRVEFILSDEVPESD